MYEPKKSYGEIKLLIEVLWESQIGTLTEKENAEVCPRKRQKYIKMYESIYTWLGSYCLNE